MYSTGAVGRYDGASCGMDVIPDAALRAVEVDQGESKQHFYVLQKSIVRACHT